VLFRSRNVTVLDGFAFVVGAEGLDIFEIENPVSPAPIGEFSTQSPLNVLADSGDIVFVTDNTPSLTVLSIEDPENPEVVGHIGLPYDVKRGAIQGDYIYAIDSSYDVQILDVTSFVNIQLVGSIAGISDARVIVAENGFAYILSRGEDHMLYVVNLLDGENPQIVGSLGSLNFPTGISVDGDMAYIISGQSNKLIIVDVSNATNPFVVSEFRASSFSYSIAAANGLAFIGSEIGGFHIIDVADSHNPVQVGNTDIDECSSIKILGNFAYLACVGSI